MRLLLADDEKELTRAIEAVLKHNNYSVDTVYNGQDALDWAEITDYDGIILDIMMPKLNGLDVLKCLRASGNDTPILLLTAKGEVEDKVLGLDKGADDYLTKPFAMNELLARIRAMTRRKTLFSGNILKFHGLILDRNSFELSYKSQTIHLGNKEYQMIEMLMNYPEHLVSTEQFLEKIWGYNSETNNNVIWVYLSYLRKKLEILNAPIEIHAYRGLGYKIELKTDS